MKNVNPSIKILEKYKGSHNNIQCLCLKHNELFMSSPTHLLNGKSGCQKCRSDKIRNKLIKSHDNFINELCSINKEVEVLEEYTGSHNRIKCLCKKCNYVWSPTASSLLCGFGCPSCSESHGEKRIKQFLDNNNIKYVYEKKYDDLLGINGGKLSYDFYLIDYNCLIEYQGEFHDGSTSKQSKREFEIQKEHDRRKKEYANNNNIKLIEIWYWDYDNIEYILGKEFVLNKNPVTTTAA